MKHFGFAALLLLIGVIVIAILGNPVEKLPKHDESGNPPLLDGGFGKGFLPNGKKKGLPSIPIKRQADFPIYFEVPWHFMPTETDRTNSTQVNFTPPQKIVLDFMVKNPSDSLTQVLSNIRVEALTVEDMFNLLYSDTNDNIKYQCIRLSDILRLGNDLESSQKILDLILERDPLNIEAIRSYSLIFEAHNNPAGYADFLSSKLKDYPAVNELRVVLANFYIEQRNLEQAISIIQDAQLYDPSDDYYPYILNYFLSMNNINEENEKIFEE
jgi:hypothetical protein